MQELPSRTSTLPMPMTFLMAAILIVDDMPIFREPIDVVLRAEGFETATASNGHEALIAMIALKPALVLLDLGMPVMDGIACLKNIRADKNFKSTPVIVLSAESDRARILEALKLGVSGYLLKSGFSLKAMLEKVRATLEPETAVAAASPASPVASSASAAAVASTPAAARAPARASAATTARVGAVATPLAADVATKSTVAAPKASERASAPAAAVRPATKPASALPLSENDRENAAATGIQMLKPILTRSDLLERLKACEELKGFSPTVSQVLNLTAKPDSSVEAVSKAVRQDQAMALKILKVANSSVYSRGGRVDTVQKAILRIGMESIRQAVLNVSVVERFSSPAFKEHLSTAQFWEHSIACGIIAAELAHASDPSQADAAFTSGLLHDLGRVIFAEALTDQYLTVIETARRLQAPLEVVETRMLLLNHADVMDRLLSAWKFPKHLVDPIMYHHLSAGGARSISPTRVKEILRLGLANRLAHAMLLGTSGNETIYPTEEHCVALGISEATIQAIEESARQQTDDTKFALLTSASSTAWPRRSEQLRAELPNPLRPLYVSLAPEFDAYRIFVRELAGPVSEEPPNVAIVHIAAAKERAQLAERLADAEREAGVTGLPLLTLSPAGQSVLEDAAVAGRKCQTVGTPATVARFIAAVNALIAA